jgi:plastocyanin
MPVIHVKSTSTVAAALLAVGVCLGAPAKAEDAQMFNITIRNHTFDPAEVHVPAGKPIILVVKNADSTVEEFESKKLKVEKIIPGGQSGAIRLRPLAVGEYPFVGELHEDTATGTIIAE